MYKITFKIANRYGEPKYKWQTKTKEMKITGNPTYETETTILKCLNLTPNWGIEILKITEA